MGGMPLVVSLSGLGPGVPLADTVRLCDALDARRVPLTLLVGSWRPSTRRWPRRFLLTSADRTAVFHSTP